MLEIKNHGKYFVKDTELLPTQKDEFGHEDIAKNIINIIENTDAPFNIAIVGKWGIGKSSLIKKVVEHFSATEKKFVIDELNAWKYEKEALRRVFLKKVLQKLGYKDSKKWMEVFSKFSYRGCKDESKMSFKEIFGEWIPLIKIALLIYGTGVVLTLIGMLIQSKLGINDFETSNWIDFVLTIFATNIYIPILIVLIQQYIKANSGKMNFKLTTPIKTTDEYEDELKGMLALDTRKIIIVIDDLDRLTPDKIVEALDAIKAFVNFNNCIFIVPFDEIILKQALKKRKDLKLNNNEDLLIESELFLDKLFQYKIYLPNVIASDLPQYACDLVKQEAPDLYKLVGEEQFDRICKEILIHKGVTTPRQVKKIINTFSNNTLLLLRRENSNALEDIFASKNGLFILAKISVLQADFSEFYSKLFIDSDLINTFLNIMNGEGNQVVVPDILSPYFRKDKESEFMVINKSGEVLYNFLCRTSNIYCDNLLPFLYMANDAISSIFGTEISRDIRNSMTSGAEEIVKRKLEENKEKDLTKLFENILIYADHFEMENCCIILINLYEFYKNFEHQKLINELGRRLTSIYYTYGKININRINFKNLYYIYCESNDKTGYEKAIVDSLSYEDDNYIEKLDLFFNNDIKFNHDAQNIIVDYTSNHIGVDTKVTLQELFSLQSIDFDNHFEKYFSGFDLFSRLSQYVVDNEGDDVIEEIVNKLLYKHIMKDNINPILDKVIYCFSDSNYFNAVFELLYENSDRINKDTASKLVMQFIQMDVDDSSNICKLIANLDWFIGKDSSDDIDKFILENIDDNSVNDIIYIISQNEQINLIPESMDNILSNIVKNSIGYEVIDKFNKQLSLNQRKVLISSIRDSISFASEPSDETLQTVGLILTELIKTNENNQFINDNLLSQLFNDITRYASNSYAYKILNIIRIIKEIIDEPNLNKLVSWANNATTMSNYPLVTINIVYIFINNITRSSYKQVASNIMTYTNIDSLAISLTVLRKLRNVFEQEGLLNNYSEFLMRYIPIQQNRKEIIEDFTFFEEIENIPEYVNSVLKYDDIKEQAISTSVKFIQANQNINDIIQIICDADKNKIQNVNKIIKEVKNEDYNYFITSLVSSASDDDDLKYVYNLFIINIAMYNTYNEDIIKLINIIFKQGDISLIKELIADLEILPSETLSRTAKRELGDLLYSIFREEANIDNKKYIYNFVINTKTRYSFTKNEDRTHKEFTNEELELIK